MKSKFSVYYYLGAAAVILVVAYFAGYFLGKGKKNERSPQEEAKIKVDKSKLSFPEIQYSTWAGVIWEACNTIFFIDFDSIMKVFTSLKNENDLYRLITAFGVKSNPNWRFLGDERNLPQFLQYELSKDQIQKINQVLAQKGISYSFI